MKLTGKAKEDFEKWLKENHSNIGFTGIVATNFKKLPNSCKYGVFVDWFDSVDLFFTDLAYEVPSGDYYYSWEIIGFYGVFYNETKYNTRPESRKAAIEKANEIYNKQ